VTVHQHLDGNLTLTHGPHRLGHCTAQGSSLTETHAQPATAMEKTRGGKIKKPTFPPRLEIPPTPPNSYFPTAMTAIK
jgi:hypothetical protein